PAGKPKRQLRPGLDAGLEHALLVDPHDAGLRADRLAHPVEQLPERQQLHWAGGVVRTSWAFEGELDEPRSEIARVDELDRCVRIAGAEHLAAERDASRPVREAVRGIVRAYDKSGANACAPVAVHVLDDPLARCFQGA